MEDDQVEEEEEESLSLSESSDEYTVDREEDDDSEEGEQQVAEYPQSNEDRKSKNVDALLRGNLVVRRQSLLPRVLSVTEGAAICRKPFKPPCSNGYNDGNEQLVRRLWARKRFVPWGSSRPVLVAVMNRFNVPSVVENDVVEESVTLPPGIDPLVLWQPEESEDGVGNLMPIVVDPLLVRFLRPHQREGVQFMFECVSGFYSTANINGCILADDMGLGKTLQSITLLYTLLGQGFDGKPMVKKTIIVTPTSLVSNWEAEIKKWVGERVKLIALCESTREDVVSGIDSFTNPSSSFQVLIVSYETFRMHSSKFSNSESCDLLICDEAHRLKNDQTLTNRALASLSCKRRILLSGTPMQNDLEEFFAMVNFTNPGVLGDAAYFRRYYETPIICGREPTATEEEKQLGAERSGELSAKVNQFILRRTNALLSNHLPPKIVEVVCCKLTPLQAELYNHFIHSKNVKRAITEEAKKSKILAYITALKKLCNHPKLIFDTIKNGSPGTSGFEDCMRFFPPGMFSGRSGSWTGGDGAWVELSGKMHVLARLLAHLRLRTDDRIVLVSNYTQTLDLFAQLCRERRYPHIRLDGTTSISKRQNKAGGCGLNLIGGNRLVLFDPDWNPANDKQAAARVWRDGQKKRVYIYRFLSTGTIEEKVYQRQMSKEGLQKVIQNEQNDSLAAQGNFLSTEDLRDLFTFQENVRSEIHVKMNCARCLFSDGKLEGIGDVDESTYENYMPNQEVFDIGGFAALAGCLDKLKSSEKQVGTPLEEDLGSWGHHFHSTSVPDSILQASAGDEVSFVFTNQVDGKLVPIESKPSPRLQGIKGNESRINEKENLDQNSRLSRYQKPQQSPSSNIDAKRVAPSASHIPLQRPGVKRMRTPLKGMANAELKSKLSFGSQLPLKGPSPSDDVERDDNFQ
ncbi:DNA EXCISION REPAIR PROTEIN ERCC-6-RELATED [Salix viminalis]|uniref:DNA EXCISION REPAIR PROTEIN ERCC-6-RELATED n=1 Tax=Salix viminalis TaxID=40686 RepID=A0A9Q0TBR1_SALVM|nr:DNA EXCISION REPAIR PROTEIN ERCC-6-RELATED [Salix viminalis]